MYYFLFASAPSFVFPNTFISIFTFVYAYPPYYANKGVDRCQLFTYWLIDIRVHRSTIMPCFNTRGQEAQRKKQLTFENCWAQESHGGLQQTLGV